ncbi:hypothetical protein CQW23_12376 [Capsicum baccatum]|uniref:Protein FAR1-RELATED SEQUENCE n=1 Tax=Capsicum baccatum TaxID=33114 RepID=A0A2G2WSC6_CAPBA|nr:hypothetical protein CQW23_12376 [Capsicum baccatum]
MMSMQRCESLHAFFDGYINSRSSLKQFVEQYEVAFGFKYRKEMESQASEIKQLIRSTTPFNWDMQIYGHYTCAIYDFFRMHIARLPHCEIEKHIDFDAVERVEDLKNILKAHFKAYLDWKDNMAIPNVLNFDSDTVATFVRNLREVHSRGRPQININRLSHQNAFRGDARRWGSGCYDVYDEGQRNQGRSDSERWGRRESRRGGMCGSRGGRGDDTNVSNHPIVHEFL